MSRLPRLAPQDLPPEAGSLFDIAQNMMGFTPNDAVDMARNPGILKGVAAMCSAVYAPGTVNSDLKRLVGYIASTAAGCRYCQMHAAHGAHSQGVAADKITKAWEFDTCALFSDAERAALRVAEAGARSPSEVTDALFEDLRAHYNDDQIVEIVAVISMFGFLNRWNAILGTDIEVKPQSFAASVGLKLR